MKSYNNYRHEVLQKLSGEIRKEGKEIPPGKWNGEQRETLTHILPLVGSNTRKARVEAIKEYLGVSIDDNFLPKKQKGKGETLHAYAHHLNSSQLLCYMVFRNMLTEAHTPKESMRDLLASLNINISSDAKCDFEFKDDLKWVQKDEPEGTSFDFHISDNGNQYFFEIKFTEQGFGKAKNDDHHKDKIAEVYMDKIEDILNVQPTEEDCLNYYQLFRNIIRADSDSKTVIFLTDKNNPTTSKEIDEFRKKYLSASSSNVKFLTWQEISEKWPKEMEKPFQFICF